MRVCIIVMIRDTKGVGDKKYKNMSICNFGCFNSLQNVKATLIMALTARLVHGIGVMIIKLSNKKFCCLDAFNGNGW